MEGFILPTQLAHLVYGYLMEENCTSAATSFLETSQFTKDARKYVARGHKITTKCNGLSLVELIEMLGEVVCYVKSLECAQPVTLEEAFRQLRSILKLSTDEENAQKPVYLRFTMQESPTKKSPRKNKLAETNSTPKPSKSPPETASPKADGSAVIAASSKVQQKFHVLLENKILHEKLAENINKVVAEKTDVDSLESILQKKIVETIYNNTEQDPFFQEMLEELVGPVEATSSPDNTEHKNDDIGSGNIGTADDDLAPAVLPMQCQQLPPSVPAPPTTHSAGYHNTATVDSGVVVDKAPNNSEVPFVAPPSAPVLVEPPVFQPLDVQAVMASSAKSTPITTQGAPSYVIASTPGRAVLNSLVTPSVVIGTTFSGATVKFTPTLPATPHCRLKTPSRSPAPSQIRSSIKVLSSCRAPSLPRVLPKPTPPAPVALGQTIFQVPVTHQGNLASSTSLPSMATVSLTEPPIMTQPAPPLVSKTVKVGVRTRGGKAKVYPGRKKVVQTISPSAAVESKLGSSQKAVGESGSEVANGEKVLELPADGVTQESSKVTIPIGGIVSADSSFDDVPENSSVEPFSNASNSAERSKPVTGVVGTIEENPDSSAAVAASSKPENEVTQSEPELPPVPNLPSSSQEIGNPIVSQSDTDREELNASSRGPVACPTEATPQQTSEPRVHRKRLSLSTPKRGSHVRTLEFKTPPKHPTGPRKSLSSPKNKAPETRLPEIRRMLESVKKKDIFRSPPRKEKKSWDADLRQYTAEEDIPTSVGLKRKNSVANRTRSASKDTGTVDSPSKVSGDSVVPSDPAVVDTSQCHEKSPEKVPLVPTTPEKKSETDEDLVNRIQRDVLDVIDEEDVADLNSSSLCVNKSSDSPKSSPKLAKSPVRSPGTASVLEIGDIGLSASVIKKLYRRATSVDESSCTMDSPKSKASKDLLSSPKSSQFQAVKDHLFVSPVRLAVECARASTPKLDLEFQLQLTPSPQQRSSVSTPSPKVGIFSEFIRPGSASLEASLISESIRLESEKIITVGGDGRNTTGVSEADDPNKKPIHETCTESNAVRGKFGESFNSQSCLVPPVGITPMKTPGKSSSSARVGITPLKTPGNVLPSAPVEMTPLSKIINEETRLGKCTLLTPTIPPTPDYEEVKNPEQPIDAESPPKQPAAPSPYVLVKPTSPSKKLQKTPSKTPVVKLKKKAEKTPKPRKRKSPKDSNAKKTEGKSEHEKLIANMYALAAENCHLDSKAPLPDSNERIKPVLEESPPKKKAPRGKRKGRPIPEVNPEKEAMTVSKLAHFQELLEQFESIKNVLSDSSDDTSVFQTASHKPTKTHNKGDKGSIKTPKKRAPKGKALQEKKVSKLRKRQLGESKLLNKSPEASGQKGDARTSESFISGVEVTKDQQMKTSNINGVSGSPQDSINIQSSKVSTLPNVGTYSFVFSSPGKASSKPVFQSDCSRSPAVGSGNADASKKPVMGVDLDSFTLEFTPLVDDVPTTRMLKCSPYLSLAEYPLPEGGSSLDPVDQVENGKMNKTLETSVKISEPAKELEEVSEGTDGLLPRTKIRNCSSKVDEDRDDRQDRRRQKKSNSSSCIEDEKSPQKPAKSWNQRKTRAEELSSRRRRRSRSGSESKEDVASQRSVKSSNEQKMRAKEGTENGRRRRSRSRSNSIEDNGSQGRRRRRSRSISQEDNGGKGRRRRSRSRSVSPDNNGSRGRGRRSRSRSSSRENIVLRRKSTNSLNARSEQDVDSNKRRRRSRSSCSSSGDDRSRKRRKFEERRDIGPRHPRVPRGKFKGRTGHSPSPHRRPNNRHLQRTGHFPRYPTIDVERDRKRSRSSNFPGSRDHGRDRSTSRFRDHEERRSKKEELRKRFDESKKRLDDDSAKTSIQTQVDRRDTTLNPKDSHDRLTSCIKESYEKNAEKSGYNTIENRSKPGSTPLDELEDGEISEESRNTIFQFSKNSPAGGARLSSPVASASRQKLLKNVNVDKFLSLVHGDAEGEQKKPSKS